MLHIAVALIAYALLIVAWLIGAGFAASWELPALHGFNFTGGLTALRGGASPTQFNGWADFLLGLPQAMGKDLQYINPAAVRMPSWGIYARDQWQVS